ncbi:MAG TPA: hypothetical protein VE309_12135, partial [Caulobacteraceae bacterium]|nr:hypothetical protein [Caulobacteraceae bacterium]
MLPIAKNSGIRSTLLLGASALTLGVGANLATVGGAGAAAFVPNPASSVLTQGGQHVTGGSTEINTDFGDLSTSLSSV